MKARFMLENPGDAVATMKITMTIKQWEELQALLPSEWPAWKLSSAITHLLAEAKRVFYSEHEYS